MTRTWMISQTGKAIEVDSHPYIYLREKKPSYASIEWFYANCYGKNKERCKEDIKEFVRHYAAINCNLEEDIVSQLPKFSFGGEKFSKEFLEQIGISNLKEVETSREYVMMIMETLSNNLNELFLRARFGGSKTLELAKGELCFRVSSVNFDWGKVIEKFVIDHRVGVSKISVVRDTEVFVGAEPYKFPGDSRDFVLIPIEDYLSAKKAGHFENIFKYKGEIFSGQQRSLLEKLEEGESEFLYYERETIFPKVRINQYMRSFLRQDRSYKF